MPLRLVRTCGWMDIRVHTHTPKHTTNTCTHIRIHTRTGRQADTKTHRHTVRVRGGKR
jgi:hypothetical protein